MTLVLSRRKSEKITLLCKNVPIEVVVVEIRGDKVRLGFDAPKHVEIFRNEILAKGEDDD